MRIAIAGTGAIGRRHIRNLRAMMPDCDFVIMRVNGREDALSRDLGAPVVTGVDGVASYAPDFFIIATPSALHAPVLREGIAAGLPMYIEKPVITTREDLEDIELAIDDHDYTAPSMVGCNLRFLPSLMRMRALVAEGAIGRVSRGALEVGQWLPDWRPGTDYHDSYSADPARGGGVVLDLIHELDSARWLLGELTVAGAAVAHAPGLGIAAESIAGAVLSGGASGPLVTVGLDYIARVPLRRYRLVGEAGTLTWDMGARRLLLETPERREDIDCGEDGFDMAGTYLSAMAELMQAIRTGGQTTNPLEEGLRSCALAIAIKEKAC